MTFKLPSSPAATAGVDEIADYIELRSWIDGKPSRQEGVRHLVQISDNMIDHGCDDEDNVRELVGEAMEEIQRRSEACADGYPFRLQEDGLVVRFEHCPTSDEVNPAYLFLLLGTRLDMGANRTHGELDGAKLLESLSCRVLTNYLGRRSQAMVFGTAAHGGFRDKLKQLCHCLGEGGGSRERGLQIGRAKDDGLDVVGWNPFRDGCSGQLIIFGQCKSGTNGWKSVRRLIPSDFVNTWLIDPPAMTPASALFLAESVDRRNWAYVARGTGLLFDRCRLVEHTSKLTERERTDLRDWTAAVRNWLEERWR